MKIQDSQRETIFAQLRKRGKWSGRRNGHSVRIWKRDTPEGLRICWQITRRNVNLVAKNCLTLTSAIEAINQALGLVSGHPAPLQAPETMQLVAASSAMRNYRLPYADN